MKTLTFPLINNLVEAEYFSAGSLADLLKLLADDVFTGAFSIDYPDGTTMLVLSSLGVPIVAYQVKDGVVQRLLIPALYLDAESVRGPFSYATVSLSIQDLHKFRILCELNEQDLRLRDKMDAIADAGKKGRPSLLASAAADKLAMWYFPGSGAGCRESFLMDREQVIHSPALDLFEEQGAGNDGVILADSSVPSEAWVCYIQSQFFAIVVLRFFAMLEQFKGRVLLNKVMRSFNFKADANNWILSANARDINDQLFIQKPNEASAIYQQLLSVVLPIFQSEVGKPIMEGVILDSLAKFPETYWPALRKMFDPIIE